MADGKGKSGGKLYLTIAIGVLVAVIAIALIAGLRLPLEGLS